MESSRVALRRRAEADAGRPAIVWGRSETDVPTDAAARSTAVVATPVTDAVVVETSPSASPSEASAVADASSAPRVSRRAARAQRLATGEQPIISDAEPVLVDDEAIESAPVVEVVEIADAVAEPDAFEPATRMHEPVVPAATAPQAVESDEFELIEPVLVEEPVQAAPATRAAASGVDEFELAARLFSFTGETPIQTAEPERGAAEIASTPHVASRRSRAAGFKRAAATTFSIGVVGIVGLLTVGMTTPAEAVAAVNGTTAKTGISVAAGIVSPAGDSVEVDPDDIQAYVAPAEVQSAALDRPESYAVGSLADLAAELGIKHPSDFYVNDPNAAIQWPFAVGVGISWGFVWRDGRQHEGADFTPGEGAHIQAIADGTVRIATENGGGYGVTVLIDHIIDGKLVSSRYGHMLVGSLQVKVGDHVKVGQYLGRTGNTGHSFGAHTHFEILANGTTAIDPIAWLRANAGRDSLG